MPVKFVSKAKVIFNVPNKNDIQTPRKSSAKFISQTEQKTFQRLSACKYLTKIESPIHELELPEKRSDILEFLAKFDKNLIRNSYDLVRQAERAVS